MIEIKNMLSGWRKTLPSAAVPDIVSGFVP
jgi:hypothetical protein